MFITKPFVTDRRIPSRIFNGVVSRLSGVKLHDFNCGLKAYRGEVARELPTALTPAQLAEWRKAAEPLYAEWAENARKAGYNPDTIMKDLKDSLAKYNSLY